MFDVDALARPAASSDLRPRAPREDQPGDDAFATELRRADAQDSSDTVPDSRTSGDRDVDPSDSAGETATAGDTTKSAENPVKTLTQLQIDASSAPALPDPQAAPLLSETAPAPAAPPAAAPDLAPALLAGLETPAATLPAAPTTASPAIPQLEAADPAPSLPKEVAPEPATASGADLDPLESLDTATPGAPRKASATGEPAAAASATANSAASTTPATQGGHAGATSNAAAAAPVANAAGQPAPLGVTPPTAPVSITDPGATQSTTPGAQPQSAASSGSQTPGSALVQVQSRIIERFDGRAQRFEIRLDPPELGRVDVRIEIGADKRVHAVLAAHDGAALNDLMRGARTLEQALSKAGVDLADSGLSFELASDQQSSADRGFGSSANEMPQDRFSGTSLIDVPVEPDPALPAYAARAYALGRLNLVA